MHVASVILRVRHDKRPEVLSAIDELMRRVRAWPGCVSCRLFADAEDTTDLCLVSEWDSRDDLESFTGSTEFLVLQGMSILLREQPGVSIDHVIQRDTMPLSRA